MLGSKYGRHGSNIKPTVGDMAVTSSLLCHENTTPGITLAFLHGLNGNIKSKSLDFETKRIIKLNFELCQLFVIIKVACFILLLNNKITLYLLFHT